MRAATATLCCAFFGTVICCSSPMAEPLDSEKLSMFLGSGIYHFPNSTAVFIDPVRVLNRSYSRFKLSRSAYYSRSFESRIAGVGEAAEAPSNQRKRKRKQKAPPALNERERAADQRHQEVRPLLVKAHESLLESGQLLSVISNLRNCENSSAITGEPKLPKQSFVELGLLWQAPLYAITLNIPNEESSGNEGSPDTHRRELSIFCNLVSNDTKHELEAEFLDSQFIIPRHSSFYMSDLQQIHHLIPAESSQGFHLMVVDPPWENGSVRQKLKYPTLPNRYFLSLPIKQLAHEEGALVALWVTNREKLRTFVEKELFPAWGVKHTATYHWLKVREDGTLICDLDLFHHRPYETLLLGYCESKTINSEKLSRSNDIPQNRVILSVPGDFSRKPPVEEVLLDLVPGNKPRCLELFAREMKVGWRSWGNEPLCFQETKYFHKV